MRIVSTKNQFKKALEDKEREIQITGELAEEIQKIAKHKTGVKIAGALLLGGSLAAAPMTGGATLPGAVAGAVAISGAQIIAILLIIFAGSIPIMAMIKGYDVIDSSASPTDGLRISLRKKSN